MHQIPVLPKNDAKSLLLNLVKRTMPETIDLLSHFQLPTLYHLITCLQHQSPDLSHQHNVLKVKKNYPIHKIGRALSLLSVNLAIHMPSESSLDLHRYSPE